MAESRCGAVEVQGGEIWFDDDWTYGRGNLPSHGVRFPARAPCLAVSQQWGSAGSAPGQFAGPEGATLDGAGSIYVAEARKRFRKLRGDAVQ